MSAALSGGQEITSAFSRSLYYATPWIHPLSHTREQKGTYTSARARALSSNTLLTSSRVRVRARSLRAGRISENDSTSHTRTRGYLSLSPRPPPRPLPPPPSPLPPSRPRMHARSRRYVRVHTRRVYRAVWQRYLWANNNATSCKWDGYPYTC